MKCAICKLDSNNDFVHPHCERIAHAKAYVNNFRYIEQDQAYHSQQVKIHNDQCVCVYPSFNLANTNPNECTVCNKQII